MKRRKWKLDIPVFAFALFASLGMVVGAVRWAAVLPWPITALQIVAGLGLLATGISTLAFGPRHPRTLLSGAFGVPLIMLWVAVVSFEPYVIVAAFAILGLIFSPYLFVYYLRQRREWIEANREGAE